MLTLFFASLALSAAHVAQEFIGKLSDYFARLAGFEVPERHRTAVFVIFTPGLFLMLAAVSALAYFPILQPAGNHFFASLLAGMRLGDCLHSHWIPWIRGYRPNPGLETTLGYLFEGVFLITVLGWEYLGILPFAIGWAFFAGVVPAMRFAGHFFGWGYYRPTPKHWGRGKDGI